MSRNLSDIGPEDLLALTTQMGYLSPADFDTQSQATYMSLTSDHAYSALDWAQWLGYDSDLGFSAQAWMAWALTHDPAHGFADHGCGLCGQAGHGADTCKR